MKFGIDENNKFYVEYTSCPRPVGNMRQELDLACQRIASEGKIMISLSSGLDSQVILHSFATQGLPYECAFMHHPGYNDIELDRIRILEQKYGFTANVVTIDPMAVKEEVEALAATTGVPVQHHVTKMFIDQIPEEYNVVEGIENPDLVLENGKWKMMESWNAIDLMATRFHREHYRPNRLVHIDRRSEHDELGLSMLIDDIAQAYRYAFPFIKNNGLVEKKSGEAPLMVIWGWTLYIKPIMFGKYWKDELLYFPKFAVQQQVEYQVNPHVRHDYLKHAVFMDLNEVVDLLTDYGSSRTKRFTQK
jgi:hypothetical protein